MGRWSRISGCCEMHQHPLNILVSWFLNSEVFKIRAYLMAKENKLGGFRYRKFRERFQSVEDISMTCRWRLLHKPTEFG